MTETHLPADDGVTPEWRYDGTTGAAHFPSFETTITVLLPFADAQKIAAEFRRRYRLGYRDGIAEAKREIQSLERRS